MIIIDARGRGYTKSFSDIFKAILTLDETNDEIVVLTDCYKSSNFIRRYVERYYGCQTMLDVSDDCFSIRISNESPVAAGREYDSLLLSQK